MFFRWVLWITVVLFLLLGFSYLTSSLIVAWYGRTGSFWGGFTTATLVADILIVLVTFLWCCMIPTKER